MSFDVPTFHHLVIFTVQMLCLNHREHVPAPLVVEFDWVVSVPPRQPSELLVDHLNIHEVVNALKVLSDLHQVEAVNGTS